MKTVKKKTVRQGTRRMINAQAVTPYGLLTYRGGETAFFLLRPTCISVLPEDALAARVGALVTLFKSQPELEILCLNSRESFANNTRYLEARIGEEENPYIADLLEKHIQDMRSVAGGEYCLLIAPENGTDGLLVRSEGSSCARYSAYIPGGRLMTLVTPELERALRKCETAAKEAVRRECMQTLTGKWTCSLAELDAAFGAGLQENKILRDLLQIGLPDNTYLVHRDADIGVCPADGLRLDALPEKIQTAWNDVLAAQVCWIRQGAYGPEIVLAGVDPQRVYDFSFMLIEEIDECPGQAPTPGLSME